MTMRTIQHRALQPVLQPMLRRTRGCGASSLSAQVQGLFAKYSAVGGMWDFSDWSTIFQGGNTDAPVTAVEQPVGSAYDISKGLAREQLPKTGWVKTAGDGAVSVVGNLITITGATTLTTVSPSPFRTTVPGSTFLRVLFTNTGGATSPLVWTAGSPIAPVSGVSAAQQNLSTNSTLERVDIASGNATFLIEDYYQIRGNHLTQPTTAARLTASARVNRLVQTENFADAAWTKSNVTVTAGVLDPIGGTTAFTVQSTAALGVVEQGAIQRKGVSSVWIRRRTGSGAVNGFNGGSYVPWPGLSSSWQRLEIAHPGVRNTQYVSIQLATSGDAVDVWQPQVEDSATGVATRYQRVTTDSDYDTVGFPRYVLPDGVDDFLSTPANLNLTTCDKVVVGMGYTKVDDATRIQMEHGPNINATPGTFVHVTGLDSVRNQTARTTGTDNAGFATARPNEYGAHIARHSIPGDLSEVWWNGVKGLNATSDKGAGNFSAQTLNWFSRAGAAFFSNTPTRRAIVLGIPVAQLQMTDPDIEIIRQWLMEGA